MKKNTNTSAIPYLASARKVEFQNDAVITVTWKNEMVFQDIKLGMMKAWMASNPECKAMMPSLTKSCEGHHSIYPCIIASTKELAAALSVQLGTRVEVGDARTCGTQEQAAKIVEDLIKLGIGVRTKDLKWGITPAFPGTAPDEMERAKWETAPVVDECAPWS